MMQNLQKQVQKLCDESTQREEKPVEIDRDSKAYKQLMKAVRPVFSGDLDPIINQMDYLKIKSRVASRQGKASLNDREMTLIEEFLGKRKMLDLKMMLTGLWDTVNGFGSTPDSREGAAGCLIGD